MLKNNKGITIIALIITIIVLLILASIALVSLRGDEGVVKKANQASTETRIAQVKQEIELWKVKQEGKGYTSTKAESEEEFIARLKSEGIVYDSEVDTENKIITIGDYRVELLGKGNVANNSRVYLYKSGDQCSKLTGGWTATGWGGEVEFQSDNIQLSSDGNSSPMVSTSIPLNLDGVASIHVEFAPANPVNGLIIDGERAPSGFWGGQQPHPSALPGYTITLSTDSHLFNNTTR